MKVATVFGAWLMGRRNTLGLARKELAERVGCSAVMIEKIESGERRPSQQVAGALAEYLDVPADERRAFTELARGRLASSQPRRAHDIHDIHDMPEVDSAAPWRTLYKRSNNLPSPGTALIGREKEAAEVCSLLRTPGVRLVNLTGPPGIGKTRLGLRVAEELIGDFENNVCFVGLAAVRDSELVIPSITGALSLRETRGESLLNSLKRYLEDKRTLLVLDNFEQVVPAAKYVAELLVAAPWLKVLVTSREILRLYGENEYQVPPLTLPVTRHLPPVERLLEYEATRLFAERAKAVRPEFNLTSENAEAVVEICARLDMMPLAIELAAARARTLPPVEIVRRLNSNLELLTGGARDLPPRQRALRSAIDWSHDLLNEGEQRLFRRFSVFVGGCSRQGAEAVCATGEDAEQVTISADLDSLLDKSLLRREEVNGEERFSMLETIREYAWERLVESGEDAEMRRRYAAYYAALAEQARADMKGPQQRAWLDRLEAEHNNFRSVLSWALDSGHISTALELAGALWRFWLTHGYLTEGRKWLASGIEHESSRTDADAGLMSPSDKVADSVLANALNGAGNLACACGDFAAAHSLYERGLVIRRKQGDKAGIAGSLNNLALTAHSRCDYRRVKALHEESLAIKRQLGDRWGIASSLGNLGIVANDQGDYPRSRALHEESLALRRELGDRLGIALSLLNLGNVLLAEAISPADPFGRSPRSAPAPRPTPAPTQAPRPMPVPTPVPAPASALYARARALYEESLAIRTELADRPGIAECFLRLGEVEHCKGNYTKASYFYQQSLEICRELGDKPGISEALLDAGHVDMRRADFRQAVSRFNESLVIRMQLNDTRGIIECVAAFAGAAASLGKPHAAGRLFGATKAALRSTTFHLYAIDRLEYERNLAAAASRLSERAWNNALSEGAAMLLDEAAAAALQLNQLSFRTDLASIQQRMLGY